MLRNNESGANDTSGFDRDDTQLNQQDSEPTPIGLTLFGKQKSSKNMVAPYAGGLSDRR